MCGICGIADFTHPVDREELERMTAVLSHRGPDDSGLELLGPAALGFRRLSVIDLAGSHQPLSNRDKTLWLVFNGEIYNYRELRESLLEKGHRFKTAGDGETILHLYEDHGLNFVHFLNGMFAVALWDGKLGRIVLARDRLGIKPLYYAIDRTRLLFASETKSLLQVEGFRRSLDMSAIAAYMNYSSIPGRQTCFREIRRLLPGHIATFDAGGFKESQYWDLDLRRQRDWKPDELEEALEQAIREAVRMRMVSDVPLGAFLSGGVDSSLITALMAEFSSHPVEAFSIGYGEEGSYMNETKYAKAIADRYGMRHHQLILDSNDLLRDIERVVWHLDEPCGDPAAFLTLALSEFTRKHVTVALSGLGADELFAGYRRYAAILWRGWYMRIPRPVRDGLVRPLLGLLPEERTRALGDFGRLAKKFIYSVDADSKKAWSNTISYLPAYDGPIFTGEMEDVRRSTYTSEPFEEYWSRVANLPEEVDRVMYMDIKMYMIDQLLMQQDKMSMAVSLEARVPYLDHRLVELSATVPVAHKLSAVQTKTILKKIAEKYVPKQCIYRRKKGFGAPVDAWLRGPLREQVYDLLSPDRVRGRGIFQVDFVEWMKRKFYSEGRDLSIQLYQVFLLENWLRLFSDGSGRKFADRAAAVHSADRR